MGSTLLTPSRFSQPSIRLHNDLCLGSDSSLRRWKYPALHNIETSLKPCGKSQFRMLFAGSGSVSSHPQASFLSHFYSSNQSRNPFAVTGSPGKSYITALSLTSRDITLLSISHLTLKALPACGKFQAKDVLSKILLSFYEHAENKCLSNQQNICWRVYSVAEYLERWIYKLG